MKVAVLFTLLITFGFIMSIGANAEAQQPAKKDDGAATTKKIDPTDPTSAIYLDTAGKAAGVGDPNKPAGMAYQVGRAWHPAALAGANL
ncbi:MAG: hypothetical protein HY886_08410, partial [Deltaproteobacteria bacterium]|nr:hypothetical protein [Deltaproteobacteria bacterium]